MRFVEVTYDRVLPKARKGGLPKIAVNRAALNTAKGVQRRKFTGAYTKCPDERLFYTASNVWGLLLGRTIQSRILAPQ